MEEQWYAVILATLREMPSQVAFEKEREPLLAILRNLSADQLDQVYRALRREVREFRPTPNIVLDIVAETLAPCPDVEIVYSTLLRLARRFGPYGQRHESGRYWIEGAPDFPHPIYAQVVERLGGWATLCAWDERTDGQLHRRITDAWKSAKAIWQDRVKDAVEVGGLDTLTASHSASVDRETMVPRLKHHTPTTERTGALIPAPYTTRKALRAAGAEVA